MSTEIESIWAVTDICKEKLMVLPIYGCYALALRRVKERSILEFSGLNNYGISPYMLHCDPSSDVEL